MRGFASLLFAAALAAHLGPAGAPSLGAAPVCDAEAGVGGHGGGEGLYPATALGATQAETLTDGRERTGRPEVRRALPHSGHRVLPVTGACSSRPFGAWSPASLLGFPGHPSTAPPLQA